MHKLIRRLRWSATMAIVAGVVSFSTFAQTQNYSGERTEGQKSRAEQEADAKVAFSAETIIGMLSHETGLFSPLGMR